MGIDGGVRAGRKVATAAPLARRFLAWLLDSAIVGVPAFLAVTFARHSQPSVAVAIPVLLTFAVAVINYAFAFTDGRWHRALSERWSRTVVIDVR